MINFDIESEDSSDHWRSLRPADKTVLDLGCGRWCDRNGSWDNLNHDEFSPVWIKAQGAKKIIGVDASKNEIDYFNEKIIDKTDFVLIHDTIDSADKIKELIKKYSIDFIKSDIEGAEAHFLSFTKEDFDNIGSFAVEYHNHDLKNKFAEKLPEWGFTIVAHGQLWVDGMGVWFAEK